ncbi:arginase family protein [Plantactinospora sp. GCM10030261]|uniref:arginase family protein n=1 Tax=Plantactinospora sp. GCM10030261 TaxID=3273420 RepID=UPI0036163D36
MSILVAPYHLDEHLPELDLLLPPGTAAETVVPDLPAGDAWRRLGDLYDAVARAVDRDARAGAAPTVVSGDCMVSLGVLAGLQRAGLDPAVVWFDAHGDVQTLETTTSGYLGGIPLRIMTGYRPDLISERLGLRAVDEDRVLLVDARDLDPPEVDYLSSAPIRRSSVAALAAPDLASPDLTTPDVASPAARGGDMLPDGPLFLHVDLDVADPAELPPLRYPAVGGPSLTTVVAAIRRVLSSGRVVGYDIGCTWLPGHEVSSTSRALLLSTIVDPV